MISRDWDRFVWLLEKYLVRQLFFSKRLWLHVLCCLTFKHVKKNKAFDLSGRFKLQHFLLMKENSFLLTRELLFLQLPSDVQNELYQNPWEILLLMKTWNYNMMKKSVFLVHVYWIGKNSPEWLTENVPVIWCLSSKFLGFSLWMWSLQEM